MSVSLFSAGKRTISRGLDFFRREGLWNFLKRLASPWQWIPTIFSDLGSRREQDFALSSGGPVLGGGRRIQLESDRLFGVNVVGYLSSEKGLGEAGRLMSAAIMAAGIPASLVNVKAPGARNREFEEARASKSNPHLFNLVCLNGGEWPGFVSQRGERFFRGRYNIALWHWELQEFPMDWIGSFRYVDEVWVPTRFVQDCVSAVSPVPVLRIPLPALAAPNQRANCSRADFGLPEGQFIFLSIFDFHGVMERKNPFGLIEAFRRAFGQSTQACLVLKCTNAELFPRERARLRDSTQNLNIHVIEDVLDRPKLNALYSLSDCYVSLHRGEGFGLTLVEAMRAGKPVISTAYSGNLDFMTESNSYLVPAKLVEMEKDYFPYKKGSLWADPDLDAAAAMMLRVKDNPEEVRVKCAAARETVERLFDPGSVGKQVAARLGLLYQHYVSGSPPGMVGH